MAEPYCDLCELPLATCVHGNPPKVEEPVVVGPTITASTYSPCGHCPDRIVPDEPITYTDEGWIHAHHVQQPVSQFDGFEV